MVGPDTSHILKLGSHMPSVQEENRKERTKKSSHEMKNTDGDVKMVAQPLCGLITNGLPTACCTCTALHATVTCELPPTFTHVSRHTHNSMTELYAHDKGHRTPP